MLEQHPIVLTYPVIHIAGGQPGGDRGGDGCEADRLHLWLPGLHHPGAAESRSTPSTERYQHLLASAAQHYGYLKNERRKVSLNTPSSMVSCSRSRPAAILPPLRACQCPARPADTSHHALCNSRVCDRHADQGQAECDHAGPVHQVRLGVRERGGRLRGRQQQVRAGGNCCVRQCKYWLGTAGTCFLSRKNRREKNKTQQATHRPLCLATLVTEFEFGRMKLCTLLAPQVQCTGLVPTVAIDKVDGCQVSA